MLRLNVVESVTFVNGLLCCPVVDNARSLITPNLLRLSP